MTDILIATYPWIKSLHVIAVISWMAGLLYLPRLFVYHVETDRAYANPEFTFEKWEALLLRRIMDPAMGVTWLCGLIMVATPSVVDWSMWYPWIKGVMVFGMSWYHNFLKREHRALVAGRAKRTGREYRMLNEVPTVLMIVIVIMVIAKPF